MALQDISQSYTDDLSPLAQDLLKLGAETAYTRLVVRGGRGGNAEAKPMLESASGDHMIRGEVRSRDDARAMLAGLWLYHDWLDASHEISQGLHSETGSFWHAIMHRREGDFSNSQYWYARCRRHPVLTAMAPAASAVLNPLPADKSLLRLVNTAWDPDAFVDLVEAVHDNPEDPRHAVAVSLQQTEWRLLFDHCTRAAAGK
jgi:hypothetical protein